MVDLAKLLKDIDDDIELTEILGESPKFNLRCKVAICELAAERDALKAELKATESRLHEVAAACANAEFELEAARKQEPYAEWKVFNKGGSGQFGQLVSNHPMYDGLKLYASPVPAQQAAAPIAFTENDLLEIASSYSAYAGADGDMYLSGWVKSYEAKGFISLINNRQRSQVMGEQLLKGGENER